MNLQDAQRILVNEQRLDAVIQFLASKFPEDFQNPQEKPSPEFSSKGKRAH